MLDVLINNSVMVKNFARNFYILAMSKDLVVEMHALLFEFLKIMVGRENHII